MGFTSGNPNILLVEEINLNHRGRVVLPRPMRKILGVEEENSKVKLILYKNRTLQVEKS